jgi:hypothetical protein
VRDLRATDKVYGGSKDEEYLIIQPIGNGAFDVVYEIQDRSRRSYALKTIATGFSMSRL